MTLSLDVFPQTPLNEQRLDALQLTWEYVRQRSPYYGRVLPDVPPKDVRLSHLRQVPVCGRDELAAHYRELRCTRDFPSYLLFTGGTTGLPKPIPGTETTLASFYERARPGADGVRPLFLMTGGQAHGMTPVIAGRLGAFLIPLQNRHNYEWAQRLLTARFDYPGFAPAITQALLPLPAIKKLVHFLLEQEQSTDEMSLTTVVSFAWYLSAAWRRRIREVLGAEVVDSFGVTEIMAGRAIQCAGCGYSHYGAEVIWEAVDPWDGSPVDEGVARLLVSALYPYTQDLVLLRYSSGDLVELGPWCELVQERGFRFRGRDTQSISVDEDGRRVHVLFPTDVQELVDCSAIVGRAANVRYSGVTATEDDSFPRWRATRAGNGGMDVVRLEIELKMSPALFRDEWRRLQASVTEGLLSRNTGLADLVGRGRVALEVVGLPPGGIPEREIVLC